MVVLFSKPLVNRGKPSCSWALLTYHKFQNNKVQTVDLLGPALASRAQGRRQGMDLQAGIPSHLNRGHNLSFPADPLSEQLMGSKLVDLSCIPLLYPGDVANEKQNDQDGSRTEESPQSTVRLTRVWKTEAWLWNRRGDCAYTYMHTHIKKDRI